MESQESGIYRVEKTNDYTVIHNSPLNDERLSWQARGVLAYLITKPNDWQTRFTDLVKKSPASGDAIKSIISELKHFGYMQRLRIRDEKGAFQWITKVYEVPNFEQNEPFKRRKRKKKEPQNSPLVDFPPVDETDEKSISGFSTSGQTTNGQTTSGKTTDIVNTESPSTDLLNTDLTNNGKNLSLNSRNEKKGEREVFSKFSFDEWYDYIKYCKETLNEPINSIEAVAQSNYYSGIRDTRLQAWKDEQLSKSSKQAISMEEDEIKFVTRYCPNCNGSGMEVVKDGKGGGARRCSHSGLVEKLDEAVAEHEIDLKLVEKYKLYVEEQKL